MTPHLGVLWTGGIALLCLGAACGGGEQSTGPAPPPPPPPPRHEFFVSPAGSASAEGSRSDPLDLATALRADLTPGDTIWLRGGTYRGEFESRLEGGPGASGRILVKGFPGERAIVDGRLRVGGAHTWFWGFEVMFSDPGRISSQAGPFASDIPRPRRSVDVEGPGTRLINMVLHDLGQGAGLWASAPDAEVYGSIIYHNGWQGTDRGHGHGLYVQNETGSKLIEDNIVFQNFSMGIQVFGSEASVRDITLRGNILFNTGVVADDGGQDLLAWGSGVPLENYTASGNLVYRTDRRLAASLGSPAGPTERSAVLEDNYIVGRVNADDWESFRFRGNTVVGGNTFLLRINPEGGGPSNYSLTDNHYFRTGPDLPFLWVGTGFLELSRWQALGLDAGSTVTVGDPVGVEVFVRPNRYEPGRAHVAILNWDGAGAADVDLSAVLQPGDGYEVRDVQDLFGEPVAAGTYQGGTVAIPLGGTLPVQPIGGAPNPAPAVGPEFQAFLVLPTGG